MRLDLMAALDAKRLSDAREEQPQKIVDTRDRADGGTRIGETGFLLDGDGRGKPVDAVDVGLLDLLQQLARVCGDRFQIAPSAFGVERVEGK